MVSALGVLFLGLLAFSEQAKDTSDQCTVVNGEDFNTPMDANVLSYITPDSHLNISLFQDIDFFDYREVLETTNHYIRHYNTRKKKSNINYIMFPLMMPEGWNRLRVRATDKKVTLQWTNGNDEVTLLALTLVSPLNVVCLRGNISVCSGDSPEWDVKESNVTIHLQPLQTNQLLEVTGNGSLIVDHKTSPESPTQFANTTLRIKTWRKDSHSKINISEQDEGEQGITMTSETPRPHLTVRSEGGVTLRLILSGGDTRKNDWNVVQNVLYTLSAIITSVFALGIVCTCVYNFRRRCWTRKDGGQTGQNQEEDNQERVPMNTPGSSAFAMYSSERFNNQEDFSGRIEVHTDRQTPTSDISQTGCFNKSIKNRSTST